MHTIVNAKSWRTRPDADKLMSDLRWHGRSIYWQCEVKVG